MPPSADLEAANKFMSAAGLVCALFALPQSTGELWELLKTGRKFRALGKKESFALLRWGPMAVADLVATTRELLNDGGHKQ